VTKMAESQLAVTDNAPSHRAVDVLAERLPKIPKAPEPTTPGTKPPQPTAAGQTAATPNAQPAVTPNAQPAVKKSVPADKQKKIASPAASQEPANADGTHTSEPPKRKPEQSGAEKPPR